MGHERVLKLIGQLKRVPIGLEKTGLHCDVDSDSEDYMSDSESSDSEFS